MNILTIFMISMLGSTHCAGMCGGFATFCGQGRRGSWLHHLSYNGGRLVSYIALGMLAGLIGSSIDLIGVIAELPRLSAVLLGIIFITFGFTRLTNLKIVPLELLSRKVHQHIVSHYRILARRISPSQSGIRPLLVGILSALLPCGWLYSFVAAAGATGSVAGATLTMVIFWLGTLPVLLTIGKISHYLFQRWGIERSRMTAAIMLVAGLLAIAGHLGNPFGTPPENPEQLTCH